MEKVDLKQANVFCHSAIIYPDIPMPSLVT